jgi:hypothetical protein
MIAATFFCESIWVCLRARKRPSANVCKIGIAENYSASLRSLQGIATGTLNARRKSCRKNYLCRSPLGERFCSVRPFQQH